MNPMTVPLWSRTCTQVPWGGMLPYSRRGQYGWVWQITYWVPEETSLWSWSSIWENR